MADYPECAQDCLTKKLPATNYSKCAPKVRLSEIRRIAVAAEDADPFVNVEDPAEWEARLALPLTNKNAVRWLTVIGDMPAGTPTTITISNGRQITLTKQRVVNYTIDDVSDENYEFMRSMECGGKLKAWLETEGARLFGGDGGILGTHVQDPVLTRGADGYEQILGVMSWSKKFAPKRTASVMYDGENGDEEEALTFDTVQTFAAAVLATSADVATTVPAIDADLKMEFNAIDNPIGADVNMTVRIGTTNVATVTFPDDYLGSSFRFTDTNGIAHGGTFAAGTVVV